MKRFQFFICLLCCITFYSKGEVIGDSTRIVRPVWAMYGIRAGSSHISDTYLTPIKYQGWGVGFDYSRQQAMSFAPESWLSHLDLSIDIASVSNPPGNSTMWDFNLWARWGMLHRWSLPYNLNLAVGPTISADLGCLYLSRNGNNPASAKAAITIDAHARLLWSTKLWGHRLMLRYEAELPVIGAFFSPDYGELYYEIYLGNHSNLAHCAWWGDYFKLEQRVLVEMNFGGTSLIVGYKDIAHTSKVNNITNRVFSHYAVVGLSGEFISINPRKPLSKEAKIISSCY